MNNGKLFDNHHRVKCPGMLTSKLTGLFGWRHTYRVHDRQKGLNHFHNNNLQKTYSLNLSPKRYSETTSSNPSLLESSSSSSSAIHTVNDLKLKHKNYLRRQAHMHASFKRLTLKFLKLP